MLLPDGFDPVDELYTGDQLGQLVVFVEAAPAFLGGLGELEDHGERGFVGQASLRSHGSMAHGGERAFDGIAGSQVLPVLGREVVEGQHRLAVLDQALHGLVVLDAIGLGKSAERGLGIGFGLGHQDSAIAHSAALI